MNKITQQSRAELSSLEEILIGYRRGEYSITNEVSFACGHWLMDHSTEVLALVDETLEKEGAR